MDVVFSVLIEIFVFLIVASGTFGIASVAERGWDQRRRLGGQGPSWDTTSPLLQKQVQQSPFFEWVQSSTSISDTEARQKLRGELSLAGFDSPVAPVWYVIIRFGLAIGLPLLFLILDSLLFRSGTGFGMILTALALCALGLLLPRIYVSNVAATRRSELEVQFPDALDLMVVCVEAGLSLDATFVRVAGEVRDSHRRIAREFGRVSEEVRAGRDRSDALRAMAERVDVPALRSFVALIIQSEALGASIAQSLRTYSHELRQTRYLKAEEKAMRIPVLMTIPLVACILPVIITAVLLPAIIDVIRVLVPILTAHH